MENLGGLILIDVIEIINFHFITEPLKKNNPGVIVGVGLAGLFLGIAICGAVFFIITRRLKETQNRWGFKFQHSEI